MVFIRPVSMADLEPLLDLAGEAGVGLTTLPKDRDILARRIRKSQRSLEQVPDRPGGETYLFVMQDTESGKVAGASGIVSKVGGFEPFYAYKVRTKVHASDALKVRKEIQVLHLSREHNGPAEIGSLYLSAAYRKKDYGRLLQLVRLLFLAEHPDAFEPLVVSELRGMIDADGRSAFWDAVGRHFFDIEFPEADYLSVVSKKFIAELMPTHPIYIPLLPRSAQEVIGKVHESSKPALRNLESEGFRFSGMVDIFDAGPCVSCRRDEIRTVRESRVVTVAHVTDAPLTSPLYMFGTRGSDFRACMGPVELSGDEATISSECAKALNVTTGQPLRIAPLRPALTDGPASPVADAARTSTESVSSRNARTGR